MEKLSEKNENARRFAQIWSKSRKAAGKSQEYMAIHLKISKRTVQNWEHGVSAPDLFTSSEWFRILGINPLHYYLSFLYPEMLSEPADKQSDDKTDMILETLIKDFTPLEKRELLYLISGRHGSSWYSLLQMFTAHCHTSMKSRVAAARIIAENYEMEAESGELVCPEAVQPDLDILKNALDQGKKAAQKKKNGYTVQ